MSVTEIPYGTYDVEIGESFSAAPSRVDDASSGHFHTLKYDFKPKSVASEQETYISIAENRDAQVVVPNENLDHITVYKGPMKPIKGDKECVLIFDHDRNKLRLEKLSSNISLKKTRDNNVEDEDVLKEKIQEMRLRRRNNVKPMEIDCGFQDPLAEAQRPNNDHVEDIPPAGKKRTTSLSGILTAELASSPSGSSSSSSSDSESSDSDTSSSSDDEDNAKTNNDKEKSPAHESDDEHVQAIEKLMSESGQAAGGENNVRVENNNASVVLNDLYMSDDNPSGSESD